jgi:glutathione S-transferase
MITTADTAALLQLAIGAKMIVVYGSSLALSVRKVLAFVAEKRLVADHRPLAPHEPSPAFKAAGPFGYIPGFRDGSLTLSDSTAICHCLERKYPHPALFPASADDYGRMVLVRPVRRSFPRRGRMHGGQEPRRQKKARRAA